MWAAQVDLEVHCQLATNEILNYNADFWKHVIKIFAQYWILFSCPQMLFTPYTNHRMHLPKMIGWLNVRAVVAIKASQFEGRTPPLLPLLCLLLYLQLSSSSLSCTAPPPWTRLLWGLHVQTLSFRLGPHCQLRGLLSPLTSMSWIFLPTVTQVPRPMKTLSSSAVLLIHFCQFQDCHSNQIFRGEMGNSECV